MNIIKALKISFGCLLMQDSAGQVGESMRGPRVHSHLQHGPPLLPACQPTVEYRKHCCGTAFACITLTLCVKLVLIIHPLVFALD